MVGVPTERAGTLGRGGAPSRAGRALGGSEPGLQGPSRRGQCPHSPAHIPCPSSVRVLWLQASSPGHPHLWPPWPLCGGPDGGRPRGRDGVSHKHSSPRPLSTLQISPGAQRTNFCGPGGMGSFCTFLPSAAQGFQAARPNHPPASSVSSSGGAKEDHASRPSGPWPRPGPIPHSQSPVGLACPLPTCVAGPLRRDGLSTETGEWLMPCLGSLFLQLWPQTPGVTWGKGHQRPQGSGRLAGQPSNPISGEGARAVPG